MTSGCDSACVLNLLVWPMRSRYPSVFRAGWKNKTHPVFNNVYVFTSSPRNSFSVTHWNLSSLTSIISTYFVKWHVCTCFGFVSSCMEECQWGARPGVTCRHISSHLLCPQDGLPDPPVLSVSEQSGCSNDCLYGQEVEGFPVPSLQALLCELCRFSYFPLKARVTESENTFDLLTFTRLPTSSCQENKKWLLEK